MTARAFILIAVPFAFLLGAAAFEAFAEGRMIEAVGAVVFALCILAGVLWSVDEIQGRHR